MGSINLYRQVCNCNIVLVIYGLDYYDSQWSLQAICDAIELQDDLIAEVLCSMDECGALDMLTVLCEIVDLFCMKDGKDWFYNHLRECSEAKRVIQLKDLYHQKKVMNPYALKFGLERDPNYILSGSISDFENFIWNSLEPEYLRKIGRRDSKNISLWYPGLYVKSKKVSYLKKLESRAFPCLIADGMDIKESGCKNQVTAALIRMRIADFLIELDYQYYSKMEREFQRILDMDMNLLAKVDYKEFSRIMQDIFLKETGEKIYVSDLIVNELEKMVRISEYFGDSLRRQDVMNIKCFFPLFYQLLGRDEKAIEMLIDQVKYLHPGQRVRKLFLMTFYRSLLSMSDEQKRQRLISVFDEVYLDHSGIREFQTVAEDIADFYKKHAVDLCERKSFFVCYEEVFPKDVDLYVFNKWFKNNNIANTFSKLLKKIKYASNCIQYEAINDFIKLFNGLTSHRDNVIRIDVYWASKILEPDAERREQAEVMGFYTEEERQQICKLAQRMNKTIVHMPHFDMIRLYCDLKDKAEKFWGRDTETILCEKLMTAFRGIQSDSYNNGNEENALNNSVAFFLRAYYGEANVHREEPQGESSAGYKPGHIDILIYQNGMQIAIQEALILSGLNKKKIDDHMVRMLEKYDTQGVPYTILVIYAINKFGHAFFDKVETYLMNYPYPYQIVKPLVREESTTANICHHTLAYAREGMLQRMHVFTVLIKYKS